jgi:hypothetical protein
MLTSDIKSDGHISYLLSAEWRCLANHQRLSERYNQRTRNPPLAHRNGVGKQDRIAFDD